MSAEDEKSSNISISNANNIESTMIITQINNIPAIGSSLTAETAAMLDQLQEGRERRRTSIQSLKKKISTRRFISELSEYEEDPEAYELNCRSRSSSFSEERRISLRSRTSRQSMEALRIMELDLDDDSDENEQQKIFPTNIVVSNNNDNKSTLSTPRVSFAEASKRGSSRGDIVMENLRQLAAALESDNLAWESSSEPADDEEDTQTGSLPRSSIKSENSRKSSFGEDSSKNRNVLSPPVVKEGISPVTSKSPDNRKETDYESKLLVQNFAMEHRIFLKAALDLLAERERFAVEASLQLHDPDRIIKAGSLKKSKQFAKGIWKVKYVEIKTGVLSYYEDHKSNNNSSGPHSSSSSYVVLETGEELHIASANNKQKEEARPTRKVIPLVATDCRCRAVKLNTMSKVKPAYGFIFEISLSEQGIKSYWMASSTEERKSWMRAIREAMVGGSHTRATTATDAEDYYFRRRDSPHPTLATGNDNAAKSNKKNNGPVWSMRAPTNPSYYISPYQACIEKYLAAQQQLKNATDKQSYMGGMSILWRDPLRIPVQWIRLMSNGKRCSFYEENVETSIQQLWKDLVRDSVCMNGDLFKGDSGHGPERIMGALAARIRLLDKLSLRQASYSKKKIGQCRISQAQAISYARDILLACNRTRSAGDSYYCMEMLCSNPELVVICPFSSEALPLNIVMKRVANDGSHLSDTISKNRGWLLVRSRKMSQWESMYCELSDGVLNYYQKEHPTPQKLRGQIVLVDAKIGCGEIVSSSLQSERCRKKLHRLVNESSTSILELSNDFNFESTAAATTTNTGNSFVIVIVNKNMGKDLQLSFNDEELYLSWKLSLHRSIESCNNDDCSRDGLDSFGSGKSEEKNDDDVGLLQERPTDLNRSDHEACTMRPGHSTVQITVEASTVYKICTTDPQGDDSDDTWATIQTKFVQSFQLSGGSSGKIARGEEIVQMLMMRGSVGNQSFDRILKLKNKAKLAPLEGLSMRHVISK